MLEIVEKRIQPNLDSDISVTGTKVTTPKRENKK